MEGLLKADGFDDAIIGYGTKKGSEDSLASEFEFNRDIIKDKFMNEELTIHLLKED